MASGRQPAASPTESTPRRGGTPGRVARVFDHVTLRTADQAASVAFYAPLLAELGIRQTASEDWIAEWDDFSLSPAGDEHPPTSGLHLAFGAPSRAHVDRFWEIGRAAGHPDAGAPGPRSQYREDYYGAFLRDPDGNSAEAVHHGGMRPDGHLDHLWLRVADLERAAAFYEEIAPFSRFKRASAVPGRVQFAGEGSTFTLLAGEPVTEHVHLAFPAHDDAVVQAFHRTALAAGYRDNGAPGERAVYHAGYYGAFVLDPDANNVEVVNHHRPA
jgi:catechol 2,3-dioxygenase-like lactoylglutathione lyase family enzyme